MIKIENKEKCCGCSGCLNICPKNAIKMVEDEKGFKYPKIDEEKCINCGLCEKVCPIINKQNEEKKDIITYACINKNDDERENSSSGGIFILIAKEIIKKNGVVFGAQFDENFDVIHSYAETKDDLMKFMGSKYVQSDLQNSYKMVKKFLDEDRYVLFTGTPCQIEGLKSFLRKDYKKLYTQDIICHGVPSPMIWRKYKEYRKQKDGEKPLNIFFRDKTFGWHSSCLKFQYKNSDYKNIKTDDYYMRTFLKNTILRDSCYACSFKKKYRISDITLADFWGIQNELPEFDDDKGTSLMIINSEKGKEIFEDIRQNLKYKQVNLDDLIKYNSAMIKSSKIDPSSQKFYSNINKRRFDKNVKKNCDYKPLYKKIINKIKNIKGKNS